MSHKQNDRNEYCAALSTMVLLGTISIIIIIALIQAIFNLL